MAGLNFDITGDNSNFLRKLDEARNGIRSTSKQIEESGVSIEQMFERLAKGAAAFGAGFSAQQFASQVMKVRGEFQQLEVAFNTMLGSEEKANTLMAQLVKTAATTPFDLQSVAGGAKQLLAYGTAAEDVNGTLIRLGDIAAGLSIPLGDLVYLYGTTMAQGRLYTQDFNQFTGRGIPMISELAKQFGVAESEVKKLVESGKVGFPEVQKVIESLTNEGGKFGGLMEAQSKTITGQISNIEDSIATMYNNIGKQSEGFINNALSGVSYLVENYETIGKTILELAAVYGIYKAVLMSVAAYQSVATGIAYTVEIAELSKLIPLKQQSANQDIIAAVASGKLTQSKAEQVIALRAEIATKIQSLQATKAQAQAEFSSALATYKASRLRYTVAQEQVALAQSQMSIAIKSGTVEEIANAKKNAQTASLELNNAAVVKNTTHKSLNIAATNSKSASEALNTLETGKNSVAQTVNTASTNILTTAKTRLAAASKALGLSMLADPYIWVAAAITGLGYVVYKAVTSVTEAEKAQSRFNKVTKDVASSVTEEQNKLSKMNDILQQSKKGSEEWKKAKDAIVKQFGEYFTGLDAEIERTGDLSTSYEKLSVAIKKSIAARNFKEFAENENKQSSSSITESLQATYKNLQENYDQETANQLISKVREYVFNGSKIDKESLGKIMYGNWAYINMENAKQAKIASDKNMQNYKDIYGISDQEANEMLYGIPSGKEDDKKTEVLNKSFWETQKKDAETAIDAIDSKQRKLLNAGKFDKVDSKVVANYKEQKRLIAEAEKELKAYPSASDTSKQDKATDKLREDQEKYNLLMDEQKREEARMKTDSQHELEQIEIDGLEEGSEKVLRQRKLNHDKEIEEIKREAEDKKVKAIEAGRKAFETNPANAKKTFDVKKDFTDLQSTKDLFASFDKTAEAKTKTENTKYDRGDDLKEALDKYQSFNQQRLKLEKEYQEDEKILIDRMSKAKTEEEKKQIEEFLNELAKRRKKGFQDISKAEIEDSGIWKQLMGNLDALPTEALGKLIDDAEKLVSVTNLSATEMQAMMETINNARQNLIARNPYKTLKEEYEKYRKAVKSGDKDGAANAWGNVKKANQEIKDTISVLGDAMSNLGNMFSDEISAAISNITSVSKNLLVVFEELGKENPFENIAGSKDAIAAIINIIATIGSAIMNATDDSKELQERNIEYQRRQEGYWESINYQTERYLKLLEQAAGNDYFSISADSLKRLEDTRDKAYKDIVPSMPVGDVDRTTFGLAQLFKTGKFAMNLNNSKDAKEIFDFINSNGGYDLQNRIISEDAI